MITVFTVGDSGYFPGVVALVNSLDATGHDGEIVILDLGFTAEQRAALAGRCTLFALPPSERTGFAATYFKLVAPQSRTYGPEDVIVLIDSDVIVTGSLDPLIGAARDGRIVAFADRDVHRWYAEWESLFSLPSPPRHQPYVNAGLVIFAPVSFPDLLASWSRRGRTIGHRGLAGQGLSEGPTVYGDQDALNVTLMADHPAEAVFRPDPALFPMFELIRPFSRVMITDRRGLACRLRGRPCIALHSVGSPKPWRSLRGMWHNAYVALLTDLLTRDDLAVRPPAGTVPRWLRTTPDARALRVAGWAASAAYESGRRARRGYFRLRTRAKLGTRLGLRR